MTVESKGLPSHSMDEDHNLTFNRLSHAAEELWLKTGWEGKGDTP